MAELATIKIFESGIWFKIDFADINKWDLVTISFSKPFLAMTKPYPTFIDEKPILTIGVN